MSDVKHSLNGGNCIAFRVDGIPKGLPRGRATIRGRHAGIYDPGTADGWKHAVALGALPYRPNSPIEGPISVSIEFIMPRPKSKMRKKDPDGKVWCASKPDVDNLEKAVLDALTNAGWWHDDAQVVRLDSVKVYHSKAGRPGAAIYVEWNLAEVAA